MISPKFSFWFGVWTSIIGLVGAGTVQLVGLPDQWIPIVKTWALNFTAINSVILTALYGFSGNQAGPLTGGEKK